MVLKRREDGKIHESWHEFQICNMSELLIDSDNDDPDIVMKKFPHFSSDAGIEDDEWYVKYSIFKWNKEKTGYWLTFYFDSILKMISTRAICSVYAIDHKNNQIYIGHRGGYCKGFGQYEIGKFLKKNSDEDKIKFLPNDTLRLRVKLTILLDDITPLPGLGIIHLYPKADLPVHFKQLYDDRSNNGDIAIQVDQKLFKVHRHILEIRCPKLLKMIVPLNAAQDNNIFQISDIESEVFEKLLEFIYSDDIIDLDDHIESLIEVADTYELNVLKCMCEKSIAENFLTLENADYIQDLAETVNSANLYKYIHYFKQANVDPWVMVDNDLVAKLLPSIRSKIRAEK